ncbi:ribonuclease H-like domain-containing protein [Tanacetum coccineum]
MNEPNTPITPHHITPPTSPPQPDTHPSYSSTPIPPQPDTPPSHSSTPIPTSAPTQSHAQTVDRKIHHKPCLSHPMSPRFKAGNFKPHEPYELWLIRASPVVKPATIRTVLSLAVSRDWPIHQLDVKNAFLHGHLSETRSLYGLSTSTGGPWFSALLVMLHELVSSIVKLTSLYLSFIENHLLLYVDDIILTASSSVFLLRIIASLHSEFAMTDLGSLNYFLGIFDQRSATSFFLSQSKFVEEILERAHMQNCNPCRTPVDTESKLGSDGDPVSDPTLYRSLAGALQYLTFTRPDLSYAVQQVLSLYA